MTYVMSCMLFSYIYYICRVAHGHRQVGRLALRTSDTCYIYIYTYKYTYWADNVRSCKWNMLCVLFSFIYYICRVAHGHRQVGRLALRTSDTCYVYTCVIVLLHFFCCFGKNMVLKSNGGKNCLRTLFPFLALGEKLPKRNGANWR